MKYLVTGGAGFIGSHITDVLVERGQQVVVLDNLSSGHKENLSDVWKQIEFIHGDIRDPGTCLKAAEGCNGVFHEAALVSVPDSINRPRDNHDINSTGTLNILEAARANGVKRVVFASSAAIYGDNPELPKREDMLPAPKSPYALAKLTGEYYLKVYAECYGLETVALRYFNVFGPRQDPSSMYSGVISIFSERIKKGLPVTIYGDGQQTRDFVNVKDVSTANLLAMTADLKAKSPDSKFSSTVFNVATGTQTSLLQMLSVLEQLCGITIERKFAAVRSGDIRHSVADVSKIRNWLAYEPRIELKAGLSSWTTLSSS